MKKIFIFAAAAAMFASCAQDELINEIDPSSNVEQAIGFGTVFDKMTRAENNETATTEKGLENYNETFLVWANKTAAGANPSVMFRQLVTYNGGAWTYAPLRYWDKAASNYRFFAVSPAHDSWAISKAWDTSTTPVDVTSTTTTMDNISKLDFKYTGYEADGLSLAQIDQNASEYGYSKNDATDQTDDVFTEGKDLMIATDQTVDKWNNGAAVNLHFNHILSRLNIAVKSGITATSVYAKVNVKVDDAAAAYDEYELSGKNYVFVNDKYYELVTATDGVYDISTTSDTPLNLPAFSSNTATVDGTTYNIYTLAGSPATNYVLKGNTFYVLTGNATDGYAIGEASAYTNPTKVLDQSQSSGIVKLTSVKVFNMISSGDFDEAASGTFTLTKGTDKRWNTTSGTTNTGGFGVSFTNNDNATKFTNNPDPATSGDYVANTDISTFTNVLNGTYKFFYQGLVVPQTINYEALEVTGPTSGSAASAKPYIEIKFTIDGEPFTYYYNLAGIFSKVNDPYKDADGFTYYKTDQPEAYAYEKAGLYYKGKTSSTAAVVVFKNVVGETVTYQDANGSPVYYNSNGSRYYPNYDATAEDEKYSGDPINPDLVILGEYNNPVCVTRGEAVEEAIDSDARDITFCEGWQNNLYITIAPANIKFEAEVYRWTTKEFNDITVE